jgi:hypothetical protein
LAQQDIADRSKYELNLDISDVVSVDELRLNVPGKTAPAQLKVGVADSRKPARGVVDVVLGAQWGDEGKGKLVDILSSKYSICARVAGGSNAGHTIVVDVSTLSS